MKAAQSADGTIQWIRLILLGLAITLPIATHGYLRDVSAATTITVDGSRTFQTMLGIGGDIAPWLISQLNDADKRVVLDFAFKEMGLNLARMNILYHEGATASDFWGKNDNADPFVFNKVAFNFCTKPELCSDDWSTVLPYARSLGLTGEYLGLIQGPRWNGFDGASTFNEDEMVENQLATFVHLRDDLGIQVKWLAPFSEPSGGGINWPITIPNAVNVVKKLGARLEANGFTDIKMIVPDATSVSSSITFATAILQDSAARKYVGAIGYHAYDTGSGGESPSSGWLSLHAQIRALATSYGLPVRQTELCCFGDLMQRANHIFNELEYANSQTYFPQFIYVPPPHQSSTNNQGETDQDSLVFFNQSSNGRLSRFGPTKFTGVAAGHYSRYAKPGSVRLGATSGDPRIRVQAFRDDARNKLEIVIINNKSSAEDLTITTVGGLKAVGSVEGIQTQESLASSSYWVPLTGLSAGASGGLSLTVPARSVTSLEASLGSSLGEGQKLYFAQFADGAAPGVSIFSQVTLVSLDSTGIANATVEINDDNGNPLTVDLNGRVVAGPLDVSVPPDGAVTLKSDGLGPLQVGSVTVASDRKLSGVILFAGSIGAAGVGESRALRKFVAPMETRADVNTGIAVMGLGQSQTIQLELRDEQGKLVARASLALGAKSHIARFVTEFPWDTPPDFSNFSGTLTGTGSTSFAATVLRLSPGEFATMPVAEKS